MYGEYLALLEASALGQTARSSVWLYPLANLLHVLGAALLVGAIAVFDVLILRGRLLEAVGAARVALPIAAIGLLLQALSGPVLLAAEATALGRNPVFLAKSAWEVGYIADRYSKVRFMATRER